MDATMVAGSQIDIPFILLYVGAFVYFIIRSNGDNE